MQETNLIREDIDRDVIFWYRANNLGVPPNQPIRNTHEQRKRRVDNARRYANGENMIKTEREYFVDINFLTYSGTRGGIRKHQQKKRSSIKFG